MSYFNIGGNTGYALGPIVVTPLVLWLGLTGGLVAMLPVVLVGGGAPARASRRPLGASRRTSSATRVRGRTTFGQ